METRCKKEELEKKNEKRRTRKEELEKKKNENKKGGEQWKNCGSRLTYTS
jgi:hypothetical protein